MSEEEFVGGKTESERLEERKKHMEISIDMYAAGLLSRRMTDHIEFMNMELNKTEGTMIPKFRRCNSCGKFILLKSWIKTHIFKKKHIYFHKDCFQKLAESFKRESECQ